MKEPCSKNNSKKEKRRVHRVAFMLNENEHQFLERYLQKYKITNKSNWYRSTIMTHVLKILEEDYPTLFHDKEMRR